MRVCINRREPKNSVALGPRPFAVREWMTPRNTPLHYMCYPAKFGRSRSNSTSVIKEIRLQKMTTGVPNFEVIGTDTDRSVTCMYNFLLKLHSNQCWIVNYNDNYN